MKRERIFSLIVILACLIFVLVGCVGNKAGINSPLYNAPERSTQAENIEAYNRVLSGAVHLLGGTQ